MSARTGTCLKCCIAIPAEWSLCAICNWIEYLETKYALPMKFLTAYLESERIADLLRELAARDALRRKPRRKEGR